MDHQSFLSAAARHFEESAIRKTGALAGRVPDLISFAPGYPASECFPWDELKAIAVGLLDRRDGQVLQYGATADLAPLIDEIVDLARRARAVRVSGDEVVVTTGSQQGLDLAGRVLLDPGDVVLVELPTYSGAIAAFRNLQADVDGRAAGRRGALDSGARRNRSAFEERRPSRAHGVCDAKLPKSHGPADVPSTAAGIARGGGVGTTS